MATVFYDSILDSEYPAEDFPYEEDDNLEDEDYEVKTSYSKKLKKLKKLEGTLVFPMRIIIQLGILIVSRFALHVVICG